MKTEKIQFNEKKIRFLLYNTSVSGVKSIGIRPALASLSSAILAFVSGFSLV